MRLVNPVNPIAERLSALDALLFDLDGTVVNTIPHILASFRHATAEVLGEALPDDVLLEHVGVPLARQMRYFTDDEDIADRLLAAYRAFNHVTHDEMALVYDTTIDTLEALAATGIPMGIVTSKSAMMAHRGINLFELGGFFSAIVTADDTPVHKPDPLPIRHAAELLGADVMRCAYVGDSPADVMAARSAGAVAIGITWGVTDRDGLAEADPDLIIDDIAELVTLVGSTRG
jgi:pyrophosphatase PpaX